jgi:hypothetical protein
LVNLDNAYTTNECPVCNTDVLPEDNVIPVLISRGDDEEGFLLLFHVFCRDSITADQYKQYIQDGKYYFLLAFPEATKEHEC